MKKALDGLLATIIISAGPTSPANAAGAGWYDYVWTTFFCANLGEELTRLIQIARLIRLEGKNWKVPALIPKKKKNKKNRAAFLVQRGHVFASRPQIKVSWYADRAGWFQSH